MMPFRAAGRLALAAAFLGTASAATAAQSGTSAADACELHVFSTGRSPAPPVKSMFVRALPPSDDPFAIVNIVSPTARFADLGDDEIRQALGLGAGYAVRRHSDRVITRDTRKSPAPLAAASPSCYAELMAYEAMLMPANRSASGRDELSIRFLYREFEGNAQPRFRFDGSGHASMKALKKTAKDNRELALADLRDGSRQLLGDFGRKLARRRGAAPSDWRKDPK